MKLPEIALMAFQNLWARKSRTAFNIFGIVVSCSMLLLVFAGSRGAREGLLNLFENSDFARQIAIRQGRKQSTSIPMSQLLDENGVSKARMQRINEKLSKDWERKNLPIARIDLEQVERLRRSDSIASVLPNQTLSAQMTIEDQKVPARAICFSARTSGLEKRMVAGVAPDPGTSTQKIWINEYRAWQLGYRTDVQLQALIGTKVRLRFRRPTATPSPRMKRLGTVFGVQDPNEVEQIAESFRKLFDDIDRTSLSEIEKAALREAAKRLGLDSETEPETLARSSQDQDPWLFRDFEIAGIVKLPDKSVSDLFQLARSNSGNDLLIDWRDFHDIEKEIHPNRVYYYCVGTVHATSKLKEAIAEIESFGFQTRSALEILEKAEAELGKVRLIIASIAFVILLIATVGIMNTMIISVMERTSEFGIMKAIGATDDHIRKLMLVEAALTGLLGAMVSLVVARVVDALISQFAKRYIETRIREDFDFSVFVYSFSDALIVAAIAVLICIASSLIPAHRAAKLDPVAAMKSH